ncbi:glycosyltransferase family 39 protein [Ensifer adhaerens]|uniref:ArnT family glycosyltransferase n=1 Tax=Ensifer adhaerens TaxID=106592 RepID=UPI001CBE5285|nr:glycosyltransferase family 39 protein [Ensifer adhaerens]MBZ7922203.1 glycosyltransferase family 39 protein [Ensifer adhaerens]UAX90849.1 glycosyltransferase family 39 protein [Ensifer adhaerens]UAX98478.1 glycosyltransferase family 39 protein [Ensifer adhaerens]UAY05859.1 glycosyltransferase family 39 protein [Ensifer adhaerens]
MSGFDHKHMNGAVLAAILVLAALFRLHDVQQPLVDAFSWREASTAMMADNFFLRSWNIFFPEVSWTGPDPSYQGRELQVISYITALLYAVFGWDDTWGRLVAIAFGVWGVFALHRLIARLWDEAHAHAGAFLLAIMPGAVMIDRSFLPDPAMLALVTTGAWAYVAYLENDRLPVLIAAGLLTTIGVLAKLPGIAVVVPMTYATFVILHQRGRLSLGRLLVILGVALVAGALILGYYRWAHYLGTNYPPYHVAGSGYLWSDGFARFFEEAFYIPATWKIASSWLFTLPVVILTGIALLTAPPAANEGAPDDASASSARWFFHVWFLGAALVYVFAAREIKTNPWNFHIFNVPMAALAGRGLILLVGIGREQGLHTRALRLAAIAAVVVIGGSIPGLSLMKTPYADHGEKLGTRLSELSQPGELVITATPTIGDPVAIYYSRRRGWVFPPGGGETEWSMLLEDDDAIEALEELRARNASWFGITKNARDMQRRRFLEYNKGLIAHLDKTAERVVDDDTMLIYRLAPPGNRGKAGRGRAARMLASGPDEQPVLPDATP